MATKSDWALEVSSQGNGSDEVFVTSVTTASQPSPQQDTPKADWLAAIIRLLCYWGQRGVTHPECTTGNTPGNSDPHLNELRASVCPARQNFMLRFRNSPFGQLPLYCYDFFCGTAPPQTRTTKLCITPEP